MGQEGEVGRLGIEMRGTQKSGEGPPAAWAIDMQRQAEPECTVPSPQRSPQEAATDPPLKLA